MHSEQALNWNEPTAAVFVNRRWRPLVLSWFRSVMWEYLCCIRFFFNHSIKNSVCSSIQYVWLPLVLFYVIVFLFLNDFYGCCCRCCFGVIRFARMICVCILFISVTVNMTWPKIFVHTSILCICLIVACCSAWYFLFCKWFDGCCCRCCFVVIRCVTMVCVCILFISFSDNMMQPNAFVRIFVLFISFIILRCFYLIIFVFLNDFIVGLYENTWPVWSVIWFARGL